MYGFGLAHVCSSAWHEWAVEEEALETFVPQIGAFISHCNKFINVVNKFIHILAFVPHSLVSRNRLKRVKVINFLRLLLITFIAVSLYNFFITIIKSLFHINQLFTPSPGFFACFFGREWKGKQRKERVRRKIIIQRDLHKITANIFKLWFNLTYE